MKKVDYDRIKIALLVPFFPPKYLAGMEIATYKIAKHLAKKHEVHVITSLSKGEQKFYFEEQFYTHRSKTLEIPILRTLSYWIRSFIILKKINPDIVHAQTIYIAFLGLLIKKFMGKPYIVNGHGSDVYLNWRFKKIISKPIIKNADAVIALTHDMKKHIQKIYNRDVVVIPNGIDYIEFGNISKEEGRQELGIKVDERIILYVGSLRLVKGINFLIEALSIIIYKNQKIRLILIGEGIERNSLEKKVKELNLDKNVTFIGRIKNEYVIKYMTVADVFVLPSLSEGLPLVCIEAMASGLPIIATNVGGIPEVVIDEINGFIIEPKNSRQLAEKVQKILEDFSLSEKISKKNKEEARKYDWSKIISSIENVYAQILNH